MIEIYIPGRGNYKLDHLVLDLNGTITLDGRTIDGVRERLDLLRNVLAISVVTADTRGQAQKLGQSLGVNVHKVKPDGEQSQKLKLVLDLGKDVTVAVGNGSNDELMLRESILGICVLGAEGAAMEAVTACDVLVADICAALDLLIKPERLIATLRR